jgi:hypothetical protein
MDGDMRIWPRAGGYYDQDFRDVKDFRIIESRIFSRLDRESKKAVTARQLKKLK